MTMGVCPTADGARSGERGAGGALDSRWPSPGWNSLKTSKAGFSCDGVGGFWQRRDGAATCLGALQQRRDGAATGVGRVPAARPFAARRSPLAARHVPAGRLTPGGELQQLHASLAVAS